MCQLLLFQILPRYADVIAVTMADGGKYSLELFEDGCRRVEPLTVMYKPEQGTEWQVTIGLNCKSSFCFLTSLIILELEILTHYKT